MNETIYLTKKPVFDLSDGILFFNGEYTTTGAYTTEQLAEEAAAEAAARMLHEAATGSNPSTELSIYHTPEDDFFAPFNGYLRRETAMHAVNQILEVENLVPGDPNTYPDVFKNLTLDAARELIRRAPYPYNPFEVTPITLNAPITQTRVTY